MCINDINDIYDVTDIDDTDGIAIIYNINFHRALIPQILLLLPFSLSFLLSWQLMS